MSDIEFRVLPVLFNRGSLRAARFQRVFQWVGQYKFGLNSTLSFYGEHPALDTFPNDGRSLHRSFPLDERYEALYPF